MRLTIERIRTLVLAAGVLLVLALAAFLAVGKWRNVLSGRDLPQKLGKNIVQEASGVTYMEAHAGHVLFRIHASRAEQLQNQHALLHNVQIEFFSKDGRSVDKISGSDFEYNQKSGVGTARGPVQITLTRPPMAQSNGANLQEVHEGAGTVRVETSGVTFNQNTGVLTTPEKVNFTMAGGSGSAIGAKYDSQQGYLVLDHAVELTMVRGGRKAILHATHAEFERDAQLCLLTGAQTQFKAGQARAGRAKILFRADGAAQTLDATDGFTLATAGGGQVTAPRGALVFGEHNQPKSAELEGGVKLLSVSAARRLPSTSRQLPSRQLQGSAPDAQLQFSSTGELSLLTLRLGAEIRSDTQSGSETEALRVSRSWRSPVAQVSFRPAAQGGIEPAQLRGSGGVVVTSSSRRGNAAPIPARLSADKVDGEFGPGAELVSIAGTGHAAMEQTLADGARQTASGDRIDAHFGAANQAAPAQSSAAEIQSAVLEGHVVLVQQPAPKPGAPAQSPLRAAAGRVTYQDLGQRLELTGNPSVEDGGLHLTANTIDVSQQAGEATARGDVKATWLGADGLGADGLGGRGDPAAASVGLALGGQSPAHVIADTAQFSQSGGEAVFRGHARLWQDANSISAPMIVLNRDKQTLVAESRRRAEPVQAVLLATGQAAARMAPAHPPEKGHRAGENLPAVIRVRGGEFTYTDSTHQAVMKSGTLGQVTAQAGGATCGAGEVVLLLKPRGGAAGAAEVERVTASDGVVVTSEGRQGKGAQLVYSSLTGEYALTGTPAEPPQLTDPARGTVTGAALIFNSRDDSVSIEGRGRETRTETRAPR